jgi:DNA-binding Lrp family transcriptional regulator
MAIAYVLINCEIGAEQKVIDQIKPIDGIKEVRGVFGAYDVLAKIETASAERLREIITWKIRKIDRIRSTLTLMGVEGQE